MTQPITIPRIGAWTAWRDAARGCLQAGMAPEDIRWGHEDEPGDLFDQSAVSEQPGGATVPRSFLSMAQSVVWHSDPSRFSRLYAFLWRL